MSLYPKATVMPRLLSGSLGAVLGVAAASCVSLVLDVPSIEPSLPLLFLIIICAIAIKFGSMAGIGGTIAAGLTFASLLPPRWSLSVSNHAAKGHLIWMLLCGIILSDLFGAYVQPISYHRDRYREMKKNKSTGGTQN